MDRSSSAASRAPAPATQGLVGRLRALLAPHCAVCGLAADASPLCSGCRRDFFAPTARCRQCGLRLAHGERCGRCLREQPDYDATITLADYVAPVDGLVVALKFGHRLELAALFGQLLAERLAPVVHSATLLVPVPLAFERQADRGFNQAREIARVVQRQLRCTVLDAALLRTRHGAPQESLDADARRRNVRKAFAVAAAHAAAIGGAEVMVVDDVMTSGATLGEIASVLKRAGAARVTNAIVARTP
jgi:ComF family protein